MKKPYVQEKIKITYKLIVMEAAMTIEEYNKTIKKLTQFMNVPSISEERRSELEKMLDVIDSYNGMEFLKIKSK